MSIEPIYQIIVLGSNNEEKYKIIFNDDDDKKSIKSVIYSDQQIHRDDTIQLIKKKFLKEILDIERVAYEEIYMFSKITKSISTQKLFDSISDKKTKTVNTTILKQVLVNLDIDIEIENNLSISYEEFFILLRRKELLDINYKIAIDRQFQSNTDERFSAHPYDILYNSSYSNIFVDSIENPLITLDNLVLLNYNEGKLIDNTIYVCLAEDVLRYCCEENGLDDYIILKMYYSRMVTLYDINTFDEYRQNKQRMLTESNKLLNETTFEMAKIVDTYYDLRKTSEPINYILQGISSISVILTSTENIILPLESIFKKIHAEKNIPFIKFNPGFRRENIYRLYCEKVNNKGKKVPFLKKALIFRLAKELGKKKIISFFTKNNNCEIYIDLENTGNVKIYGQWNTPLSLENITSQITEIANPILTKVNEFLKSSGYSIMKFDSLNQPNVKIGNFIYHWQSVIKPNSINLKKWTNCLRPIFEIYDKDAKLENDNSVFFRFKRVDNYREMNAQEIFIHEMYNKTNDLMQIKELLKEQFNISEDEAIEKIAVYASNEFKGEDIQDSPGFAVEMNIYNSTDISFKVEISKHIEYIDILNTYIEGFLKITQKYNKIMDFCLKQKHPQKEVKETKIEENRIIVESKIPKMQIKTNFLETEFNLQEESLESEEELEEELSPNIEDFDFEEEDESLEGGSLNIDEFPTNEEFKNTGYDFSESVSKKIGGGKDNEEEEEDEEDEDEEDEIKEYTNEQLNGQEIKKRINLLQRMKQKDKILFEYKHKGSNKGKFATYARGCPAFRYPVILTDEEKKKLDTISPDSYNNAIKYGTDPKKQYWYTCPRFWCLKTNLPISEKDAKEGEKCGKILNKEATHITEGHYVYEIERDGYTTPGFFLEDKLTHPEGHCLPCCFGDKSWTKEDYIKRRNTCMKMDEENAELEDEDEDEEDEEDEEKIVAQIKVTRVDGHRFVGTKKNRTNLQFLIVLEGETNATWQNWSLALVKNEEIDSYLISEKMEKFRYKKKSNANYIRDINKFPLDPRRWGFIPISIQYMFQTKNNMSSTKITRNKKSILRYGVESSDTKSFIGCIADVYGNEHNLNPLPKIEEMCDYIANAVSIDIFLQIHNGSLPAIFQPKQYDYDTIDYRKYKKSKFINSINISDSVQEDFMNDTIASYENFIEFIKNPESTIDYTYLWDIISSPNPLLFPKGLNLVILEIPENDATVENLEVICPTSAYSSAIYDPKKETLIITKRQSLLNEEIFYYEPIYLYNDKKNITRTFSSNTQIKPLQNMLQIIKRSLQNKCKPMNSFGPKIYQFERNIYAIEIRKICNENNIKILSQVLNFQGKLIAFIVKLNNNPQFYLPCFPSSLMSDLEIIYINDAGKLWQNYTTTRDELKEVWKLSKGALLCKPKYKVIEDGLIVGILTETNQFIMINPPEENNPPDELEELNDTNYILADINLANKSKDSEREKMIKMIQLEKYFYQVFRSTLRIILNKPEFIDEKANILKIIDNITYENYNENLLNLEKILHIIMDKYIDFQIYDKTVLLALNEISDCFTVDREKNKKPYCILNTNTFIIPKLNLINGKSNMKIYFRRLADELLRYRRIRSMIMDKRAYVIEKNDEYELNNDEIILLDYALRDYLDDEELIPLIHIKDAKITYEFANPYKQTMRYSTEVNLEEQKKIEEEKENPETKKPRNIKLVLKSKPNPEENEELEEVEEVEEVEEIEEVEEVVEDNEQEKQEQMKLECVKESDGKVKGNPQNKWVKFFPKGVREMVFNNNINCTYYPLLVIYKSVYGKYTNIINLKQILIKTYQKYSVNKDYENKIFYYLKLQGKRDLIEKIEKNETSLESTIISENYPLSNLDYWVICSVLNLSVILFTSMEGIKHLIKTSWIILGENKKTPEYYFIRAPTEKESKKGVNEIHEYRMISRGITMEEMEDFQEIYKDASMDEESLNFISFETYLSEYNA